MSHYDFMNSTRTCKACNWSGPGSGASMGEWFREGAEYHCPECGDDFGYVMYPTTAEMTSDPRASRGDRLQGLIMEDWWARVEKTQLKHIDQLPELPPGLLELTWGVIDDEDGRPWILVSHGDIEVWRELSCFEEYERFGEVARLLHAKYGMRLVDLVPTEESWFNLGGDYLGSIGRVDAVRKSLAGPFLIKRGLNWMVKKLKRT